MTDSRIVTCFNSSLMTRSLRRKKDVLKVGQKRFLRYLRYFEDIYIQKSISRHQPLLCASVPKPVNSIWNDKTGKTRYGKLNHVHTVHLKKFHWNSQTKELSTVTNIETLCHLRPGAMQRDPSKSDWLVDCKISIWVVDHGLPILSFFWDISIISTDFWVVLVFFSCSQVQVSQTQCGAMLLGCNLEAQCWSHWLKDWQQGQWETLGSLPGNSYEQPILVMSHFQTSIETSVFCKHIWKFVLKLKKVHLRLETTLSSATESTWGPASGRNAAEKSYCW